MSAIADLLLAVLLTAAPLQIGAPPARVPASELQPLDRHDDVVVRVVGDVELRASDVYRVLDLAAPGMSNEVLREMVLTTMAQLEAQREGLDAPADQLEQQIERAIAEQRARFALEVDSQVSLDEFLLQRHGLGPQAYRAEVRRMVLASMLLERVVRLNQWRSQRDELQIILVQDAQLAAEIAEKLAEGASFSVLAKQHSVHPGAAEGGFMPLLPADIDVPLVAGRAGLELGGVLGPAPITLDSKDYYRFVRLVNRLPARGEGWDQLRDEVEADLASRPLHPDELALFEASMADRYRVRTPPRTP